MLFYFSFSSACCSKLWISLVFFSVLNESAVLILHSADSEILKAPEPPKPKKNRCFMCRKKVGLTGNREPLKLM